MKLRWLPLFLLSFLLVLPSFTGSARARQGSLFQKTWGGTKSDTGFGVAIDSSGNAYVTGQSYSFGSGSPSNSSLTLLKYDLTGNLLWERIWTGSGNAAGYSVAVDVSGNIYVTGFTDIGAPGGAVLILRFDASGNLVWAKTWGLSNLYDRGFGVALDPSNNSNIYVAGVTNSFSAGYADVLLLKFDSLGKLIWQRTWGGTLIDNGQGVAVDSSGNIYVTGYTYSYGAGHSDVILLKFNSTGSLLWQSAWGGVGHDFGFSVAVDSHANAYVTGSTNSTGAGVYDVFLLKFNSTGSLQWQRIWGTSNNDAGCGVAVDSSGTAYVTGAANSFGGGCGVPVDYTGNASGYTNRPGGGDILLLSFDSSGNLVWSKTWGPSNVDFGQSVSVDTSANALVAGSVNEALPRPISSPAGVVSTPSFAPSSPSLVLGSPSFTPLSPAGVVQTPSGSQSYAGGSDEFLFKFGVLPTVTFYSYFGGGSIIFNGTGYASGRNASVPYGNYSAIAVPCAADFCDGFVNWTTTGGVSVTNNDPITTVIVRGSGTLTAYFRYKVTSISPLGLIATLTVASTVATIIKRKKMAH